MKRMVLIDEIKILNNDFKTNQAQYNLDREAANTSALSSGELENMNIQDINQEYFLDWVKFLIKDQKTKIKRKDFQKDLKILKI